MYIVFVLAIIWSIKYSTSIDEECYTREQVGTCQRFTNCPYAIRLVQQNDRPDICEFEGLQPIICCPNSPNLMATVAISLLGQTSTPPFKQTQPLQNSVEERISQKKCRKYHPKFEFGISVVGGEKSLSKEFPHMAAIGFGDNEKEIHWLCGGSLISKRFILTASHCLSSRKYGDAKWVRLGDLDLSTDTDDANPQNFTVIRRIAHSEYNPSEKYHDIALLELDRDVLFTEYVSPACLHLTKHINDTSLTATGWGQTSFIGDTSSFLLKVELQEVDANTCSKNYRTKSSLASGIVDQTQVCAGGIVGKDTCLGDSGGPLQIKNRELSNRNVDVHTIVGITSFGTACGLSRTPGVYTRVSFYADWIEKQVWANENDD